MNQADTPWQDRLAERVEDLAAAAAVEQGQMFASQTRWARELLAARGVSPAHFRASLASLRLVLTTKLPQTIQPLAAQYLDEALDALNEQCTDAAVRLLPDTPHGRLALAYLLAVLEGDRRRASHVILKAVDQPGNVREIYLDVPIVRRPLWIRPPFSYSGWVGRIMKRVTVHGFFRALGTLPKQDCHDPNMLVGKDRSPHRACSVGEVILHYEAPEITPGPRPSLSRSSP